MSCVKLLYCRRRCRRISESVTLFCRQALCGTHKSLERLKSTILKLSIKHSTKRWACTFHRYRDIHTHTYIHVRTWKHGKIWMYTNHTCSYTSFYLSIQRIHCYVLCSTVEICKTKIYSDLFNLHSLGFLSVMSARLMKSFPSTHIIPRTDRFTNYLISRLHKD